MFWRALSSNTWIGYCFVPPRALKPAYEVIWVSFPTQKHGSDDIPLGKSKEEKRHWPDGTGWVLPPQWDASHKPKGRDKLNAARACDVWDKSGHNVRGAAHLQPKETKWIGWYYCDLKLPRLERKTIPLQHSYSGPKPLYNIAACLWNIQCIFLLGNCCFSMVAKVALRNAAPVHTKSLLTPQTTCRGTAPVMWNGVGLGTQGWDSVRGLVAFQMPWTFPAPSAWEPPGHL